MSARSVPEAHVAFIGFLINYPWEMLQAPLFTGMADMRHWDAVLECSRATLGDAGILLFAYWMGAAVQRSRHWIEHPRRASIAAFLTTGVILTIVFEWLATDVWQRWTYVPEMPTLPVIGTGLAPLLQWVVLPPLSIWMVRRQLFGSVAISEENKPGSAGR